MVQKYFIGRPSLVANPAREKSKSSHGLAQRNSMPVSYQEAAVSTLFFPCSGFGSGSSWSLRGSGGNYWSRSLYSAALGRGLNFNSSGVRPQNGDYRFYGFAVRPVQ